MFLKRGAAAAFFAAAAFAITSVSASAATVTFTTGAFSNGASGDKATTLNARADFDWNGSVLTVTLQNISTDVAKGNIDLLAAVYWNYQGTSGQGTLSSVSLTGGIVNSIPGLGSYTSGTMISGYDGSALPVTTASYDAEGFMGYNNNLTASGPLTNQKYGVSNSAQGTIFGNTSGINLTGGTAGTGTPNGPAGGLVGFGGVSGVQSESNQTPVIQGAEVFKITGLTNFDVSKISNVYFSYGTSVSGEPGQNGGGASNPTPLPAAAWGGLALIAGLGIVARAKRRSS